MSNLSLRSTCLAAFSFGLGFLFSGTPWCAAGTEHVAQSSVQKAKSGSPNSVSSALALSYATIFAAPGNRINSVAVGADGTLYVAGITLSKGSRQSEREPHEAEGNAFVARLSADGSKILYFTFLDKSGLDQARAIAVDGAGNAYVTGRTRSRSFAVYGALQSKCGSNTGQPCSGNVFLSKLNIQGSVVFATYFGGSGTDSGNAVALDSRGNIYISGSTSSSDFPVTKPAQNILSGKANAFVAKISADTSHVLYATYFGGSGTDEARAMAVDRSGRTYITGLTTSLDLPVHGALQPKCTTAAPGTSACHEAFIAELSADGSEFLYSTYLGGSGSDVGNAIALDSKGYIYVAGATSSHDFPTVKALQGTLTGFGNAFVSKISVDGAKLVFSTYIGGSRSDEANALVVDSFDDVFISGRTHSPDFPMTNPLQAVCNKNAQGQCSEDAFLTILDSTGSKLQFSSYFGGSQLDEVRGIAIDAQGAAYLGGWTNSTDIPQANRLHLPDGSPTLAEKGIGSFVAKLEGFPHPNNVTCGGSTNNWNGNGGDNRWTTASNWSDNRVPISTDNVCIASSFSGSTITISSLQSQNQTIAGVISGAPISFQSGPLTVSGTATFSADLSVSSDVLTLNGSASMTTLELDGGYLTGPATITVSGLLTLQGGSMCTVYSNGVCGTPTTNAVTKANGGISISSYSYLVGRTLNNAGVATYTSGYYLALTNGAIVNNAAKAVWDVSNGGRLYSSDGTGVFNNAGTFQSSGSGGSQIQATFNNTGAVQVTGTSTQQFEDGGSCGSSCTGSWSVGSGSTLEFYNGTFALSGTISGAGSVIHNTTETLTGTYNVTGATNLAGTVSFGTVSNVGALTVSGGVANFAKNALTVSSMTLSGGTYYGTGTLTVSGLLTLQGGSMCTVYSNGVCGTPTTNAVTKANGGISISSYSYLVGRTLNNAGVASYTSGYYLALNNGTIVNNLAKAVWDVSNGGRLYSSDATGVFNNAGTFRSLGNGSSSIQATFNNTGLVEMTGTSTQQFADGGSCGSSCSGSWSVSSGSTLQFYNGIFALSGAISGAGTVIHSATETLTGTYNVTGATNLTGTVSFGIVSSVGVLTVSSGVANFGKNALTVPSMTLSGGTFYGTGTLTVTGLLTFGGGSMCTLYSSGSCVTPTTNALTNANGGISISSYSYLLGRTLNNAAAASYTSGYYLSLSNGAIVNNPAKAVWDVSNGGGFRSSDGTGVFNNAGTFQSSGSGSSSIQTTFNNSGTVQTAAVISFADAFTQTKGSTILSGGTISFSAGTFDTGIFSGSGTGGGSIMNVGAVLAPGDSTNIGTINLASGSAYVQNSKAAYDVKIGGTSNGKYDQVNISGTATLGGALNVTAINGYVPKPGDSVTVMTFSSATGQFATVTKGWVPTYNSTSVVLKYKGMAYSAQ